MNRAIKKSVWRRGTRAGVSRTNRQRDGSPGSRCRPLLFRCPFERLRGKKRRGGHTTTALLIGFLSSLSTGRLGEGGHESHSGDRKESGDPKYAGFRRKHTGLAHLETVSGWPLLLFDGRRCIATLSLIYSPLFGWWRHATQKDHQERPTRRRWLLHGPNQLAPDEESSTSLSIS